MEINRANLDLFFTGAQALFDTAGGEVDTSHLVFSTEFPSTTAAEGYSVTAKLGGMREWVGDRQIKNLETKILKVVNRDFEDTVAIGKNDMMDDKFGMFNIEIQQMSRDANELPRDLAEDMLVNGFTYKWADGKLFFSTDRKYGKNTVKNLFNLPLTRENFWLVRSTMRQYKNAADRNGKVRPTLLIVGPSNEKMAEEIIEAGIITELDADGKSITSRKNSIAGKFTYIVINSLGDEWFLADVSRPVKPVGVQIRERAVLVAQDDPSSDAVFMRKQFLYGTSARAEAFLTFPHLIAGSKPE